MDDGQAQDALWNSEERLRFAQEGAQLGIWDWDIRANVITRSDIHYRLFGQEPRNSPEAYEEWLSPVHADDRRRIDEATKRALETGEMEAEFRVVWPDNTVHWLHTRGKVYYESGQPLRMIRVVRDITAQKMAEQALAESEARKAAIVTASLDAVMVMGIDGLLQEFNPAAEEMFGYSRQHAIGKSLADLVVPPHLREAHRLGLSRYIQTGQARVIGKRIEIEAMRADGTEFPVELAIVQVPVDGPPLFAGYVRDISERKQTEQVLRRSNEELSEFAHVVAHDLQAPLRTVRSYIQLLAIHYARELSADAQELMGYVQEGARTMESLIAALLQYATAAQEAPRESVDLREVVNDATSALASVIHDAQAVVVCEPLPTVIANRVQMHQVFLNLIGNAVKYRRVSVSPYVRIRSELIHNHWLICVADNGQGIAAEYRERIFAPLARLHGRDVPGTGLGLAVCKKIVERVGGRIWVDSEPGKGSTFRFSLPVTPHASK